VAVRGFAPKVLYAVEDVSRKGAKAQSAAAFLRFSLRLCAFARDIFPFHRMTGMRLSTFGAKPRCGNKTHYHPRLDWLFRFFKLGE
jgi:hypothetical protein